MSKLKWLGFSLVVLLSAFASNCSNSDDSSKNTFSCDTAKSKCPGDSVPTSEEIASCNKALADPQCGNLYATALLCLAQHQACEADGGKTDLDKTKSFCQSELNAASPCFDSDSGTGD